MIILLLLTADLTYADYRTRMHEAFAGSPLALELAESRKAMTNAALERMTYSPLTLGAGVAGGVAQPDPNLFNGLKHFVTLTPSASLTYATRSSFAATLTGSYNLFVQQQPSAFPPLGHAFDANLNLSYEVIQGGGDGRAWSLAKAAAAEVQATQYSLSQALISGRIGFMQLMTDLFVIECKITMLAGMKKQIDQAVESGQIQVKTRVMSQKDFLNFANLETNFATQLIALESQRSQRRADVNAYGSKAMGLAAALPNAHPACGVDVDAIAAAGQKHLLPHAEVERLAAKLPSSLVSVASKQSADYTLRATKLGLLPTLSPYVTVDFGRGDFGVSPASTIYQPAALATVMAGINMSWNIPGARGTYAEREAFFSQTAAAVRETRSFLEARALLSQLNQQLDYQARLLKVLRRALDNSESLLATLDAQRAIGQVDSLNISTASLENVSVKQSILDTWGDVEKALFQIDEYVAYAR